MLRSRVLLLICLLLGLCACASAEGAWTWEELPDGTARITGYSGGEADVVLPEQLEGRAVTALGDYALADRTTLVSVTIPGGVTEVGANPFRDCSALKEIRVAEDHPTLKVQDGALYDRAEGRLIAMPVNCIQGSLEVPEGVREIGPYAFSGCFTLTGCTLPESLETVGEGAFFVCPMLQRIELPAGVREIGPYAFASCFFLQEAVLPDALEVLMPYTFYMCGGLTELQLPEGLREIGDSALQGCDGLTGIAIPGGVESIGDRAFDSCRGLTEVEIPEGVTYIGPFAFNKCGALKRVSLPESLTEMGDYVFACCDALETVETVKGSYAEQAMAKP